jgi:AAA15 family ATPase/GTPase
MVGILEIKNFKSIKELRLDCKRLNIFIGQPNTGKSNILESLGLLSLGYHGRFGIEARKFVRFDTPSNLFYDGNLENPVQVNADDASLNIKFQNGNFEGRYLSGNSTGIVLTGDHRNIGFSRAADALAPFKFYRFEVKETFERPESGFLLPPSGDNLLSLLVSQRELRSQVNDLFSPIGLRLGLRPQEHKIEVIKDYQDIIVSYPYHLVSDTYQRLIFYLSAILSNKDSVLVFEEPESHAFPYYTKYLAEIIALDESNNQYFISTHNPYFLLPILEKIDKDEVAVFITYFENYETKVKPMTEEQIRTSTEIDIFSNLEGFLEGG